MRKYDYFSEYLKLAPLQLALWRTPEVVAMAQLKLKEPILDLACGDGVFTRVLLRGKKKKVIGVDIDKRAVELAKKTGIYKDVAVAPAEELPFKRAEFATVICNSSLEHFGDIDKALKEVSRALKEKGKFIFTVPSVYLNEYWLTSALTKNIPLLGIFFHSLRNRVFGHKYILEAGDWVKKLENTKFKEVSYTYIDAKKACLVSDLFWPFRLLNMLMTKILQKQILFPGRQNSFIREKIERGLDLNDVENRKKGASILFKAEK